MSSVVAEAGVAAIDSEEGAPEGAPRECHVLGCREKTTIGVRGVGGVTSVRRREPAGCLLFGPYWQLSAGFYRLNFRCASGKPRIQSQAVLGGGGIAVHPL